MPRPRALNLRIDDAKRSALLEWLQQNPNTTVDELLALRKSYGTLLGTLTIAELGGRSKARRRGVNSTAGARPSGINTPRVRAGTQRQKAEARRAQILSHLKGASGWAAPKDILASTGLDAVTLRRSLKVLEAEGKVRRKGKARGTVWRVG